jgi:hypothetical protein
MGDSAAARSAGSVTIYFGLPGACAPGFMLSQLLRRFRVKYLLPAAQAKPVTSVPPVRTVTRKTDAVAAALTSLVRCVAQLPATGFWQARYKMQPSTRL